MVYYCCCLLLLSGLFCSNLRREASKQEHFLRQEVWLVFVVFLDFKLHFCGWLETFFMLWLTSFGFFYFLAHFASYNDNNNNNNDDADYNCDKSTQLLNVNSVVVFWSWPTWNVINTTTTEKKRKRTSTS